MISNQPCRSPGVRHFCRCNSCHPKLSSAGRSTISLTALPVNTEIHDTYLCFCFFLPILGFSFFLSFCACCAAWSDSSIPFPMIPLSASMDDRDRTIASSPLVRLDSLFTSDVLPLQSICSSSFSRNGMGIYLLALSGFSPDGSREKQNVLFDRRQLSSAQLTVYQQNRHSREGRVRHR
ncbi:hypothetical protein BJX65DRAFT_273809 [Aspergillus insuetus]